ncbi:MAG: polysaccharide deacetylase family protein [Ignavibacteria bacterium]|nr:MAG: polysaccharide deacetylase family protein [Ignavibacteria bacterium]
MDAQISSSVALVKSVMQLVLTKRRFVWKGPSRGWSVSLTFDDGPHPEYTIACLELLRKYDMKATFFLIGKNAEKYPEIVKEIHQQGHALGIHTYSHPFTLHKMSFKRVKQELQRTQNIIHSATNQVVSIYRPPRGQLSIKLLFFSAILGFPIILWNISFLDHRQIGTEYLISQIRAYSLKSGDIILLHDHNSYTIEALPVLLKRIRDKGLNSLTIPQMFGYGR